MCYADHPLTLIFCSRRPKHNDGELSGRGSEQPTPACRETRRPPEPRARQVRGVRQHGASGHLRGLLLRMPDDLPLHGAPLLHDPAGRCHSDAGPHAGPQVTSHFLLQQFLQVDIFYLICPLPPFHPTYKLRDTANGVVVV